MRALNDRVIVKVGIMPEVLKSGIILATQAVKDGQAIVNVGMVVSAGPGMILPTGERIPVDVLAGDVISWEKFGQIQYEVLGKNIVCIRASDIGCVLTPEEYDGWIFDEKEAEKRNDETQAQLAKIREEQNIKAGVVKKKDWRCSNKECKSFDVTLTTEKAEPQCEYCGVSMDEKITGPAIFVH
jgi:chaperonin GroES